MEKYIYSMTKLFKSSVAVLALGIYMVVSGWLLVGAIDHQHGYGHGHCPFELGQHAVCDMGAEEHITEWQDLFSMIVPSVVLLGLFIPLFLLVRRRDFLASIITRWFVSKKTSYRIIITPFQKLLSDGIIHHSVP